jgi:hypothetical protein
VPSPDDRNTLEEDRNNLEDNDRIVMNRSIEYNDIIIYNAKTIKLKSYLKDTVGCSKF